MTYETVSEVAMSGIRTRSHPRSAPGSHLSEKVFVSEPFLWKNGLKVGDIAPVNVCVRYGYRTTIQARQDCSGDSSYSLALWPSLWKKIWHPHEN